MEPLSFKSLLLILNRFFHGKPLIHLLKVALQGSMSCALLQNLQLQLPIFGHDYEVYPYMCTDSKVVEI